MKYQFANAEHTIVRAEDGSTFELPRHTHPSNIAGHAAEQWRREGCPTPDPYQELEPVRVPDDADRRRRRGAGDEQQRRP
jgi:hypothetical protein